MKIVIDLTSLADNFSGIERYAASISRELLIIEDERINRNNAYILIFKGDVHPYFRVFRKKEYVKMIVLKACNKLYFNQIRLPFAISHIKADIYLFLAFPVPLLSFKKNAITAIHDIGCWDCPETMDKKSKWYFRISYKAALKKCRKIITVSEFSKKRIIDRLKCDNKKLDVIYDGVDTVFNNREYTIKEKEELDKKYKLPKSYILSLSTLEPRKNLKLLLNAYQELLIERKIKLPLVLAGRLGWKMEGFLDDVDKEVKDNIIFTGFVENDDLPYIYRKSKIFIFPSKYEGFGIPPLEAMACGVPVVSSDAASMPEILGDAANYFKSDDLPDLKNKIVSMNEMKPEESDSYRNKGIKQAEKYSWKKEAYKLKDILEKL